MPKYVPNFCAKVTGKSALPLIKSAKNLLPPSPDKTSFSHLAYASSFLIFVPRSSFAFFLKISLSFLVRLAEKFFLLKSLNLGLLKLGLVKEPTPA